MLNGYDCTCSMGLPGPRRRARNYGGTFSALWGELRRRLLKRRRGWQGVISAFRGDSQVGAVHPYVDDPVAARNRGFGVIHQRVLIAGRISDLGICLLDGFLVELRRSLPAGGIRVPLQNIAVSKADEANPVETVINRQSRCVYTEPVDGDVVGEQHPAHLVKIGSAAKLTAIADHEDDLAARAIA